MGQSIVDDMRGRDFWISLVVALVAFFVTYHLPRVLKRNVSKG